MISAGCAIGLGNVWRFPYVTGKYGGGAFVLLYLIFLIILGLPIVVAEYAVGRGSGKSAARSFDELEPKGSKWHWFKYAAMGQTFFTLSVGAGSLAIFGSYIGKDRRLIGEAINVTLLDTFVALLAGVIIFPACFAFDVQPQAGPPLIFITLPNVFNHMAGGRVWGSLFFLFMSFAAVSTVIAVFQNIISFATDLTGCSVKKACFINCIVVILLSLPCVLGFNLWSGFTPFGEGSNILDLEDFIMSNNLLPLGSLIYILFCTSRYGWGFDKFLKEANEGEGLKFPKQVRLYVSYILPIIIIYIFVFIRFH